MESGCDKKWLGRAKLDKSMKMTYFMFLGMLSPNPVDTQLYLQRFTWKTEIQDGRRKKDDFLIKHIY